MIAYPWSCSSCGRQHNDVPICWSFGPPASYHAIPHQEVAARVEINDDLCWIDQKHGFIRGHIDIPIIGSSEHLTFSVWASLSDASMDQVMETWDDADRSNQAPFFGWLSNEVAPFPGSLNLATEVHSRPPGQVPLIYVRPCDHPLWHAQRDGAALQHVIKMAEAMLPRH